MQFHINGESSRFFRNYKKLKEVFRRNFLTYEYHVEEFNRKHSDVELVVSFDPF
jgi:hypothetical protein